jgi:hypothetical protein
LDKQEAAKKADQYENNSGSDKQIFHYRFILSGGLVRPHHDKRSKSSCTDPECPIERSDGRFDDSDIQLECGDWGQCGLLACGRDQQRSAAHRRDGLNLPELRTHGGQFRHIVHAIIGAQCGNHLLLASARQGTRVDLWQLVEHF